MKQAIITITPENKSKLGAKTVDVQTNGVSNLDMLDYLNVLTKHFALEIVKEAKSLGCNIEDDFDGYINFLRKNNL